MFCSGRFDFRKLIFQLEQVGSQTFFDYWLWRLNPFLCRNPSESTSTVRVNQKWDTGSDAKWEPMCTLGDGMFRLRGFRDHEGGTFWEYLWLSKEDVFARFWMSIECDEIRILTDDSHTAGYLPFVCLGYLMPSVMLKHDAITFHGVLMEHEGRGIIISAPSGTGKTTHARLWRDHKRALILNGDRATCCKEDVRWIGFSLPWSGTSGECINRDVPLTAFVVLEQSLENSVERLTGLEAFGAVMPNLLYPTWDRELTEKALDFVDDFLEKVPVFRLCCRPDAEAVETLDRALREL